MPPLVDAHLHLQGPAFAADLPEVLNRAEAAGIQCLVCNGTCEEDWPHVAKLARDRAEARGGHPRIIACFGLHPWHAGQRSDEWLATLEHLLNSTASAVGEIGLDRWIEPRDEPAQEQVFRAQLELARKLHRPAMIHCLRAWGWLMDVLNSESPLPAGMLIHAYGGPADMVKPLARLGTSFSFAGNVLHERKAKAREALRAVPLDRLLIETDSPDMPPPPPFAPHCRPGPDGKPRNEPANLPEILRGIAAIRNESVETVAIATTANAQRLLGDLWPRKR